MDRRNEDTALLALRGGLRGRFRRSFDSMENAFEVLQDRLQHAVNPAERAELMPLLEELQTQLICLRRLGDQASDAATAALLHGTCVPQPIDLLGQLREFCSILQEEAAQYALPFTVTLQAVGLVVLPSTGDVSLLNGLLTNLVSNTLAADRAAHIMLLCTPGRLCYRDNGPGLPPDAAALLTDFRAVAAAGLRSSPRAPVQGTQARQAVRLADAALQRLGAQVNPKVVLTVFAAKLRTL